MSAYGSGPQASAGFSGMGNYYDEQQQMNYGYFGGGYDDAVSSPNVTNGPGCPSMALALSSLGNSSAAGERNIHQRVT